MATVAHPVYKIGKPYEVDGVWYYPAENLHYDKTGIASWYGKEFRGRYTANGEIFSANALTAAHKTLPMPSIVRVTNLDNGRSLVLRVNDRGPFVRGRIIDVSRRAAQLLGFEVPGTAPVRVEIMPAQSIQAKLIAEHDSGQDVAAAAPAVPVAAVSTAPLPSEAGVIVAQNTPASAAMPPASPPPAAFPARNLASPPLSEQVTTVAIHPTSIYVQAGAFGEAANALRLKAKLAKLGPVRITDTRVSGTLLYRVRIGPLPSVDAADRMLDTVVDSGVPQARIVVD